MIRNPINGECEFCGSDPSAGLVLVGEYEADTGGSSSDPSAGFVLGEYPEDTGVTVWLPIYACQACLAEFKLRDDNDDFSLIELLKDIMI